MKVRKPEDFIQRFLCKFKKLESGKFYSYPLDENEEYVKQMKKAYMDRIAKEKNQADMFFINLTDKWGKIPENEAVNRPIDPLKDTCVFYYNLAQGISIRNKAVYSQIPFDYIQRR